MTKEFVCTPKEPAADTTSGKLRGFKFGTTYVFHGIRYAEAKRFMMPVPAKPREGVTNAHSYGYTAPLISEDLPMGDSLTGQHRFWPQSEDCLNLNIWTQSMDRGAKKPVLVWLHGGVYMFGSSIEQNAYDGTSMSEAGDVVVVSVNHRLNLLGFLDLSGFGGKYENTGNLGMADIVESLRWIRANIDAFGGDPENVTVFGQSGGGGKVHCLYQIPDADNLFARGIIMTGMWEDSGLPAADAGECKQIADAMIASLGGRSADILETAPLGELYRAYREVSPGLNEKGVETMFGPRTNKWYAGNSLHVGFTEAAKKKPVMVGTTFAEFTLLFHPGKKALNKHSMSHDERVAFVREKYGKHTDEVLRLFEKAYPGRNLTDAASLDSFFRRPALDFLDKRAGECGAPTYSYVFALDMPVDGGTAPWHGADIAFAFRNNHLVPAANIPGVSDKLEEQVSGAWISFARTGDPSNSALGRWPAYTSDGKFTMVFDAESEARQGYDREIVDLLHEIAPMAPPGSAKRKG